MTEAAERLQQIWDAAREGLVTLATQEKDGYLHELPGFDAGIERDGDGNPIRRKDSDMKPVGEWTYEGVSAPTLTLAPDGTWRAKMRRTCNPWVFSVYIDVTAPTPEEALDLLAERVAGGQWT